MKLIVMTAVGLKPQAQDTKPTEGAGILVTRAAAKFYPVLVQLVSKTIDQYNEIVSSRDLSLIHSVKMIPVIEIRIKL